ncbi:MAG TPA: HAMP domain-containing sensor histidine kinase [Mycobacteriales bacterium]|nr:HAMP domain-containing sensor histidine kinase [Mycobacteriales bacterium]
MVRASGPSTRLKLTLSYAGFLMLAGALLLGAVWVFLLLKVPRGETLIVHGQHIFYSPGRGALARDFAPAAAIALGGLLVVGLAGGWLLAGRMLAPLARITDATRAAATGSLTHRIALTGRNDEFRELADAFDAMLEQLDAHVAEQRRFAANASHELRTPLAITQTMLDVAHREPPADTRVLVERLQAINTRAIDLTEALLLLSRADQRAFTSEPVDLSLLAEQSVEDLLPIAEKNGITINSRGDTAPTVGSPPLLLQLVTNLLHNAIVHNTGQNGAVWLTTNATLDGTILTVENTGDQLDSGFVAALIEPFQRGTERVRSDHQGTGLGLAIAQRITRAHDGELSLAPRPGGGLRVTVRLPPDPHREAIPSTIGQRHT